MKEPARPLSVSAEAEWNPKEKEWQLGKKSEKKSKHPVGRWEYWRADGSLCCVANFDKDGSLDGPLERYHEDGTLASSGFYRTGRRSGKFVHIQSKNQTSEYYPENNQTWRYEFHASNNWSEYGLKWFLEDGRECTSSGKPVEEAYDLDKAFSDFEPDDFLQKSGTKAKIALEIEDYHADKYEKIEELWGKQPASLNSFLSCLKSTHSFDLCDEIRTFDPEQNIWRELISHPRDNWYEELASFFMGAIKIGNFGDSDGIYTTLFLQKLETPKPECVYHWSHETYYVDHVISETQDDFAYRIAVSAACDEERLSPKQAKESWCKLRHRMDVNWAAAAGLDELIESQELAAEDLDDDETLLERSDFEEEFDQNNSIRRYYWRAQWIIYLLAHDENRRMSSMDEVFRKDFNKEIDEDKHSRMLEAAQRTPLTGIYLLWRYFWFKQEERLQGTCEALKNHSCRVVRDLVSLMNEIKAGQTSFYGIENICAVRESFLKLDLCPERDSQRKIEQLEQMERQDESKREIAAEAVLVSAEGKEALLELAWKNIENPILISEIEKSARSVGDPLLWKALDWFDSRGFERDNSDMKDEAINLGEALSKLEDSDLLQPFAWSRIGERFPVCWLIFEGYLRNQEALDKRLIPLLLKQIRCQEEYKFRNELALRILNAMNYDECLKVCAKALEEFIESTNHKDSRETMIPWEEFLISIANCISSEAERTEDGEVKNDLIKLLKQAIEICFRGYASNVAAELLQALLALGEKNFLNYIPKLFCSGDDLEKVRALGLIEEYAAEVKKSELSEFLLGFYNPDQDNCTITLMYQRSLHAIKKAAPELEILELVSMNQLLGEIDDSSCYGTDSWNLWRSTLCETVEKFPELSLSLIAGFLQSPVRRIRDAAEKAFKARGESCPNTHLCTWLDVWKSLSADSIDQSNRILADLLCSENTRERSCLAGWFWQNPSQQNAERISTALKARLATYSPPGAGEYIDNELDWLLRCLVKHAHFSSAQELLREVLEMKDRDLNACVLKDIDDIPIAFAKYLLPIANSDDGWQRAYVARWALKHKNESLLKNLIAELKLSEKKLQKWC